MTWKPSLGAWPEADGVRFRVWAPNATSLELVIEGPTASQSVVPARGADGYCEVHVLGIGAGTRYRYLVDGRGPFPDPASRFQPESVHGQSEVVDPSTFHWTDQQWRNVARNALIIYELHVGTFTPDGTFAATMAKLPYLADLGVTAIELMPLGDFPGQRNWGYDGVSMFAPARCYGTPDDLRRLIDAAHSLNLAVLLDVVYNHFGPDGNYTGVYSPDFVSRKHHTPWGDALNFDGPGSIEVRRFFIENALHWIHEYHFDGLRLDATHAILDDSPRHFLAQLSDEVRASFPDRTIHLIAEDHNNLAHMARPTQQGGWGLDGIWADDFHNELRRLLAGDHEGYFRDYRDSVTDLATTIQQGWFFTGQHSEHLNRPRGTDPSGLLPHAFVLCIQNHDQIGNRAFGERLHHQIDGATYRAASTLLLCAPGTPLLFMGQEWACSSPFCFFTDHHVLLGKQVVEGRRREFRQFSAFASIAAREKIPSPQDESTFRASQLGWSECEREPHAAILRLYRELLRLRRTMPALRIAEPGHHEAIAVSDSAIVLERRSGANPGVLLVCQLCGGGHVDLRRWPVYREMLLSTEEPRFCGDAHPAQWERGVALEFARPGAVLLTTSAK